MQQSSGNTRLKFPDLLHLLSNSLTFPEIYLEFYFNFSQSVWNPELLNFGLMSVITETELTYCICLRHKVSVLDHCTTSDKSNVCTYILTDLHHMQCLMTGY